MKLLILIFFTLPITANAKEMNRQNFEKVLKIVRQKGYYNMNDHELYKAATEGVLRALENKSKGITKAKSFRETSNELIEPRAAKELEKEIEGKISGIGVALEYKVKEGQQYPTLISILPKTGASHANLKSGDKILKIDGVPVKNFKSFPDLVYSLRGPAGSFTELTLLREGDVIDKKVERKRIEVEPFSIERKKNQYVYVEIGLFGKKLTQKLEQVVKEASEKKLPLIIDLRESTGGLFSAGIDALELFSNKGEKLIETVDSKGRRTSSISKKDGLGKTLNIAVLTGKHTRSIAEGFAGALRELTGATIIGQKTSGKGTVESMVPLKNRFHVKFTVGQLSLPNEPTWNIKGILPDISTSNEKGEDHAMEVAKRILKI